MPVEDRQMQHDTGGGPPIEPGLFGRANNYFLLIYAFACYLMASSLSGLLYLGGRVTLSVILPALIGYLLPLRVLTARYGLSLAGEMRLGRPVAATAALVLAASVAVIYPFDSVAWLFERWRPADSDYISILLAFKPKGILHFIVMALGMAVLTPVGEELLFRGLVQQTFRRNMGAATAIALSGTIFAVAHGTLFLMPAVALLGVMIAWVYHRTQNLIYAILIHAVFNFASLWRLHEATEESLRATDGPGPDWRWLLGSLVVLALTLRILAGMRRERD
ncbi:MAG: type II CAAX endopeptidase family protein [Candidatus Krumholzibacteria bacterium]|nr:type II CAAX endopeptidase family protein [Candidatus Krumholzibacteria bacterium]